MLQGIAYKTVLIKKSRDLDLNHLERFFHLKAFTQLYKCTYEMGTFQLRWTFLQAESNGKQIFRSVT